MIGQYSDLDNRHFLGKLIKLGCAGNHPETGRMVYDHVKIKVSHIMHQGDSSLEELVGVVLTESDHLDVFKLGDVVAFKKEEVIGMVAEGIC